MNNDLIKAIEVLKNGEYTCVLCKEDVVYTGKERGVKPLLDWTESDIDFKGFSAADKVVGNAAAFLYVILGVKEVYAQVMSEPAASTLIKNGIDVHYDVSVKNIINRSGTGICPMEETVNDISSPQEALNAIKLKLKMLKALNV